MISAIQRSWNRKNDADAKEFKEKSLAETAFYEPPVLISGLRIQATTNRDIHVNRHLYLRTLANVGMNLHEEIYPSSSAR